MKRFAAALLLVCSAAGASADRFERITPAEAGYDAAQLQALRGLLERSGSESLLLLHQGKVFFEWGDIRRRRLVHSIRKALVHSVMGRCVASGRLRLDQTVAELGLDEDPSVLTPQEGGARFEHLLQSRSGIYLPAAAESEAMQAGKPPRGSDAPGARFHYNNWDFNAAGAAYAKACGQGPLEAFGREIAAPLGLLDWQGRIGRGSPSGVRDGDYGALDAYYQHEPERSRHPAYHLRLSAHDLALYGQLYLQRGQWQGRQLVPAEWIDASTRPISISQPEYGLGYGQLWGVVLPKEGDASPPSYFHTGLDRHMLAVYPRHQLVFVHRVNTEDGPGFEPFHLIRILRAVHAARLK